MKFFVTYLFAEYVRKNLGITFVTRTAFERRGVTWSINEGVKSQLESFDFSNSLMGVYRSHATACSHLEFSQGPRYLTYPR